MAFQLSRRGLCDGQRGLAIDAVLTGHEALQIQQRQWQQRITDLGACPDVLHHGGLFCQ